MGRLTDLFLHKATGRPAPGQLVKAVYAGNLKKTRDLLERGANVNETPDGFSETVLLRAIDFGLEDIAILLIEKNANIEVRGLEYDETPLFCAVWRGLTKTALALIDAGANVNTALDLLNNGKGIPVLRMAVSSNNAAVVTALLAKGAELEEDKVYAKIKDVAPETLKLIADARAARPAAKPFSAAPAALNP